MPHSINPGDDATVTGASGAATSNHTGVVITTESVSTAAGADFTETLTDANINANSIVLAVVAGGSNSAGTPIVRSVVPSNGSVVIKVYNAHASAAFNGTLKIAVLVM